MNILNAYWLPKPTESGTIQQTNNKPNELGFRNDIPWPLPTTVGAEYFGEGREELPLEKTLNKTIQGEYFLRGGNIVPSTGGVPMINPYSKTFTHSRDAYETRFERRRVRKV